jgi:hypothetical protein
MKQLPVFVPARIGVLKRAAVFILLGPLLGLCGAFLVEVVAGRMLCLSCNVEGAALAIFFSFWVSLRTCPEDWVLSRLTPTIVRVPLIAISGSAIAVALMISLVGNRKPVPISDLQIVIIIAAICMGLCSWLSSGRNRAA